MTMWKLHAQVQRQLMLSRLGSKQLKMQQHSRRPVLPPRRQLHLPLQWWPLQLKSLEVLLHLMILFSCCSELVGTRDGSVCTVLKTLTLVPDRFLMHYGHLQSQEKVQRKQLLQQRRMLTLHWPSWRG